MPLIKVAKKPEETAPAAPVVAAPAPVDQPAPVAVKKSLQPRDMSAEQKRIQRSGLYQAALHSIGVTQYGGGSFANYLTKVREAAEAGLLFVNE